MQNNDLMNGIVKKAILPNLTRRNNVKSFSQGEKIFETYDYSGLYMIYNNGDVFSLRKNRFIKPTVQEPYSHVTITLTDHNRIPLKWSISRLVAFHFIGPPPTPQHEVDHIDQNPMNNHYTNLQWMTHSENIQAAFNRGARTGYWLGKQKPPFSLETRLKMAEAKIKPVKMTINGTEEQDFPSVKDLLDHLGWYRSKFTRTMRAGGTYKNMTFEFI